MFDDPAKTVVLFCMFLVLIFAVVFIFGVVFRQDNSICSYKVAGEISNLTIMNMSYNNVKGEISGEVYCRDIEKMVVQAAIDASKEKECLRPIVINTPKPIMLDSNKSFDSAEDCWRCL